MHIMWTLAIRCGLLRRLFVIVALVYRSSNLLRLLEMSYVHLKVSVRQPTEFTNKFIKINLVT